MSSVPLISLPSKSKRHLEGDQQCLGSDEEGEDPLDGVFSQLKYRYYTDLCSASCYFDIC